MLATLGPHHLNYQESLSTLQFARRCKQVHLMPVQNSQIHLLGQADSDLSIVEQELRERIYQLELELAERD